MGIFAISASALLLPSVGRGTTVTGGTTTVTLNANTVTALTGLGFTIAPVAPATLGGTPLAASFPITGGDTTTMIDHSGGLAFTKSGFTADIENFVINLSGPQADTITGELVAGGTTFNDVALFTIGSGLSLTLNSQLAADLTATYGIPNLTGAAIGTASVNATTTPEPVTSLLAGLGLIGVAGLGRRRFRASK